MVCLYTLLIVILQPRTSLAIESDSRSVTELTPGRAPAAVTQ